MMANATQSSNASMSNMRRISPRQARSNGGTLRANGAKVITTTDESVKGGCQRVEQWIMDS